MQAALRHECGAETCKVAWDWVFQCGSESLGEQIPTAKSFSGVAVSCKGTHGTRVADMQCKCNSYLSTKFFKSEIKELGVTMVLTVLLRKQSGSFKEKD